MKKIFFALFIYLCLSVKGQCSLVIEETELVMGKNWTLNDPNLHFKDRVFEKMAINNKQLFSYYQQQFEKENITDFFKALADSAHKLTKTDYYVKYDPSYVKIKYPNGDVPYYTGVCTDVIIRAYRKVGIDLQEEVHKDMVINWDKYPHIYGLKSPDQNIDHRRVPNLNVFFKLHGISLPTDHKKELYRPGDIIIYRLFGAQYHIAIVSNLTSWEMFPLIIHNIGSGQNIDDCIFCYEVVAHYRFNFFTIEEVIEMLDKSEISLNENTIFDKNDKDKLKALYKDSRMTIDKWLSTINFKEYK